MKGLECSRIGSKQGRGERRVMRLGVGAGSVYSLQGPLDHTRGLGSSLSGDAF